MKLLKRIIMVTVIFAAFFTVPFKIKSLEGENVYWDFSGTSLYNYLNSNGVTPTDITKVIFNNTLVSEDVITSETTFDVTKDDTENTVTLLIKDNNLYIQFEGILSLNADSSSLFADFINVTEIAGLEYIDTSSVTNMESMFEEMTNLESLNLSSFNTNKVYSMFRMFWNNSNLKTLDLSSFDLTNISKSQYVSSMFYGVNMDTLILGPKFIQVKDASIWGNSTIENVDISDLTLTAEIDLPHSAININAKNVTFPEDSSNMFASLSKLETLDLTGADTSNVTNMDSMFSGLSSIKNLDLSMFDVSNVTSASNIFGFTNAEATLNISNWDIKVNMRMPNVGTIIARNAKFPEDSSWMFYQLSNLHTIDLTNVGTTRVNIMTNMFYGASSLEELDLTSFDNANSKTICGGIFSDMANVKTIYVSSKWQDSNCTWTGTPNLVGELGSTTLKAKVDEAGSPGALSIKSDLSDFEIKNYSHTDDYIYIRNQEFDINNIVASGEEEIKVEDNKLNIYLEGFLLKQYEIVSINSVYDIDEDYMYANEYAYTAESICDAFDIINASCKVEDNKIIIYKGNDILEQYDLVIFNTTYFVNNRYIHLKDQLFNKDNFVVTNGEIKFENGYVYIYRNDELLDQYKLYTNLKTINMTVSKTSLREDETTTTSIKINDGLEVTDMRESYDITYTSSNPSVAIVDSLGNIKGVSTGTAIITVTTSNGKSSSVEITVEDYSELRNTKIEVTATQETVNRVVLTWAPVKDATKYAVSYRTADEEWFGETVTTNSFVDNYVNEGVKTYYRVYAINNDFGEEKTSIKSDVIEVTTKMLNPSINVTSNTYNSIKITIDELDGADGYIIYRSTSKNGSYKKIKITSSLSYVDSKLTTGKAYYYKVKAYSYAAGKKYYTTSTVKYAKPTVPAPTFKVTSYDYNKNKITISKVSGATGYVIYRATSVDGKYSKLTTTTKTTYYDSKLTTGQTYYYKVRPYRTVSRKNYYGYTSNVIECIPTLKTPTFTITNTSRDSLTLNITKVNGAKGYYIYEVVNGEDVLLTKTTSLSYVHENLELGSTHTYKVYAYRVVSGNDVLSKERVLESIVRPSKLNLKVSAPAFYKQVITSTINNINEEDTVKVYLYQSTSKDGEYTLVYEEEVSSLNVELTDLVLNKTYYYKAIIEINGIKSLKSDLVYKKATKKPSIVANRYKSKTNYVVLSTLDDEQIDGYQIYRATSKNGKYSKVYEGTNNYKTFKGTYNKGYYYKIRYYKIYDGKKVYSEFSSVKYAKFGDKRLSNY